jgi:hypothetical protein
LSRTQYIEKSNGFLLSMLSPVWRARLCGEIGVNKGRVLDMDEEDASLFMQVVALGCGNSVQVGRGLEGLMELVRMADQYQVEAIQGDLEEAVMDRLTVDTCEAILTMARGRGLVRLERASRDLATSEFDQFAECAGFMDVSEEVLGSLLDEDALVSESEERVLKGVVRWMKGGAGSVMRGEGLLCKIRFPFMSAEFLADEARGMLPDSTGLEGLVLESAFLKSMAANLWGAKVLRYLDSAVLVRRRGRGVNWAECSGEGQRRLATGQWVMSVSAHGRGLVCGGLHDGSIRVWNRATLEVERTLTGHTGAVRTLLSVKGWLISGSDDCVLRVWDVAKGRCEGTLTGHTGALQCLAVSGGRLVSGGVDKTARVWRMEGAVSTWRCERTFAGHGGGVNCVATWGCKVASGSGDTTIRVWDADSEATTREKTLSGHEGYVSALVACGQRLFSSSADRTVKVWSMATWACVQTVPADPAGSTQFILRLAVSGPTLVGGTVSYPPSETHKEEYEVRVWDLETLEPLHMLRLPAEECVAGLASDGGEVWGAVGPAVVVWGRGGGGGRAGRGGGGAAGVPVRKRSDRQGHSLIGPGRPRSDSPGCPASRRAALPWRLRTRTQCASGRRPAPRVARRDCVRCPQCAEAGRVCVGGGGGGASASIAADSDAATQPQFGSGGHTGTVLPSSGPGVPNGEGRAAVGASYGALLPGPACHGAGLSQICD